MKNDNSSLHWSKAQELVKVNSLKTIQEKESHRLRLENAREQFMESIKTPNFTFDKFEEACLDNDIDAEDLFHRLI